MISLSTTTKIISLFTFLVCYFYDCSAKDNITKGEPMRDDGSYLESSPGKMFQMGFFSREKTSSEVIRRYVGIWYTKDRNTIVWVANRDNPVMDSTGVLTVAEDGNVKIESKDNYPIGISTTTATEGDSPRVLKLLDNGNAVLINISSGSILWESFTTPTDTFLPGMIMGADIKLKSWKSPEDPGFGSFVFQSEPGTNRYSILKASKTIWKSGNMSMDSFDDNQIVTKASDLLSNTTTEPYSRLVMSYSGNIQLFSWSEKKNQWDLDWHEPKDNCSIYSVCGPFGMCNENNKSSLCSCMDGFEPISHDDNTAGCKRISGISQKNTKDTFVNETMISMDDTTLSFLPFQNESACIKECLENNQCLAYAYSYPYNKDRTWAFRTRPPDVKQVCWIWNSEPVNLKENGVHNISFRISGSLKGLTIGDA